MMTQGDPPGVRKRLVLHFPGFEPLNASAHRMRYARTGARSARVWDMQVEVGPLVETGPAPFFDVVAKAQEHRTESRIHVFDHDALVSLLCKRPLIHRLAAGYVSAGRVVLQGGLVGYFRQAWRFGLFFVFPFLLVALAFVITVALALAPLRLGLPLWHLLWSLPAAFAFFRLLFLPQAEKLHTMHLFADWQLAVAMACLDRADVNLWLETCTAAVRAALLEAADPACDEVLITSHSMGSSIAAHVIGTILEREPQLLQGRRVVFVTLGGAILQCALLRPAARLRARIGLIADAADIFWLEVQCLTDSIHFYKSRVAACAGHPHLRQASIVTIRLKHVLSAERYRRNKLDFLRVHRQYVLAPDMKGAFDFTLMTAGPLPASDFAGFSQARLPDLKAVSV